MKYWWKHCICNLSFTIFSLIFVILYTLWAKNWNYYQYYYLLQHQTHGLVCLGDFKLCYIVEDLTFCQLLTFLWHKSSFYRKFKQHSFMLHWCFQMCCSMFLLLVWYGIECIYFLFSWKLWFSWNCHEWQLQTQTR